MMSNTNDHELCLQFTEKYITDIQHQLHQCNNTLMAQNLSCPESLSLNIVDHRLKEYIDSQQKHFRRKIDHQLSKSKEDIQEKQLYHTLFNGNLTHARVEYYTTLMILISIHENYLFIFSKERNDTSINDNTR